MSKESGRVIQEKAGVLWSVANTIPGHYKPHEYGLVILPMVVVNRFYDCLLPTKAKFLKKLAVVRKLAMKDDFLRDASGYRFYNTSKLTYETLCADQKDIGGKRVDITDEARALIVNAYKAFDDKKEAPIADLEAYKKSLIFEVVPGKREIWARV